MILLDQIILEHQERYREELIFLCGLISTDGQVRKKNLQIIVIHSVSLSWINKVKNILDKILINNEIYPCKTPKGKDYYKLAIKQPAHFISLILNDIGERYMMEEKYLLLKEYYYNMKFRHFTPLEDEFLWLNDNEKVIDLANHIKFTKQSIWRRKKEIGII